MTISKQEQQVVIKNQNETELVQWFRRDVLSHKKFENSELQKGFSLNGDFVTIAVRDLGEPTEIGFTGDDWFVILGGQKAKKISKIEAEESLPIAICKAMIIYVRKYL